MIQTKEKRFLKDHVAKKILSSSECQEYLIRIIALSLNLKIDEVKENIQFIDTNVSNQEALKQQEVDVLLENDKNIFNIEINYNSYEEGIIKNSCYIANLIIKQIKSGERYQNFKKVSQINLNNYDIFHKGAFLYRSRMMEENYHIKRDDLIEIIDINLDFLNEVDYTDIKKLDERDLEWLLYIFVCSNEVVRKELYEDNHVMRKVYEKMDQFTESLNKMLYYDPEEFRKQAEYNQGRREGMMEGQQKRNVEIAQKMIDKGLSTEEIAEYVELSIKEIEELKNPMDSSI